MPYAHDQNIKFSHQLDLHIVNCGECGGQYALSKKFVTHKEKYGGFWNCPYCQTSWGYGESTVDKLKDQLEREQKNKEWYRKNAKAEREARERVERQRNGMKGQLKKTQNRLSRTAERIKAGVCPCCSRTFKNLQRHMEGQHPGYAQEQD